MKRSILCFMLAAFFALPAVAAAEVHGVYIAPKFLLGIQDSGQISTSGNDGVKPFKQHSQAVFGGALAVGYNFAPKFGAPFRTEIEYALRSNSSKGRDGRDGTLWWDSKQTMNISTLFVNAYFDIDTGTPFTPYLGGGLGMAFNHTSIKMNGDDAGELTSYSKNQYDTTFAWNLGAGVSYAFTENVSADLGYRFIGAGHREIKKTTDGDRFKVSSSPYINEFYLGARFTF